VWFLIDADLPRSLRDVLVRHGHDAVDLRDIGLAAASDAEIAAYPQRDGLCLITGDFGFADVQLPPR
jgi:predicted nuclease of predicted toxin-antitoxin system